jgi:hypothetical protein
MASIGKILRYLTIVVVMVSLAIIMMSPTIEGVRNLHQQQNELLHSDYDLGDIEGVKNFLQQQKTLLLFGFGGGGGPGFGGPYGGVFGGGRGFGGGRFGGIHGDRNP